MIFFETNSESSKQNAEWLIPKLIKQGDEEGLKLFYRIYGRRLLAIGYNICNNRIILEEVLQDTAYVVWVHAGNFDPSKSSFTAWVILIFKNKIIDVFRSRSFKERRIDISLDFVPEVVAPSRSRDDENRKEVLAIIQALPSKYRKEAERVWIYGDDYRQAAHHFGVCRSTFKSRMHQILKRLKVEYN